MGAVLIVVVASGCGADGEEPSSRPGDPGSTSTSTTIYAVPEDDADLTLVISNQSFEDETVRIDVAVDGVQVVDQDFAVEGQHNWIWFPLAAPAGEREVTATSDSGVTTTFTVDVPEDDGVHATVNYWYYPDQGDGQGVVDRSFTVDISDDPPVFS